MMDVENLVVHLVYDDSRFGHPFVLYLERTVTWDILQKEILEKMRHLLRPGVFVQVGAGYLHRHSFNTDTHTHTHMYTV